MMGAIARPLALFFLSLLVFGNTLSDPFVHDDTVFIVQNPSIGRWDNLEQAFAGTPAAALPSGINSYYRPLLEVIYRLEYALFGLNPAGWHLANAAVHGLNAVLVWRLLGLLGFEGFFAPAAAAIFAVHPLQSEAVACVSGLSNLWMAFFVLLTLIFHLRGRWPLALASLFLGLLAKEQAVMAVPLLILVDWYQGRKRAGGWIFAAFAVGFLALRQAVTGSHLLCDIFASPGELKLRLWAIAQVLVTDVRMFFWPADLHYYRSTDILAASKAWWLLVIPAGLFMARAGRTIRFGALWLILTLLPVLNIVPLINEYSLILTAEHFLYLPIVGLIIICGALLKSLPLPEAVAGKPGRIAFVLVLAVLSFLTIRQNTFWRSETALFERTVRFEPNFARAHLLLAKAYYFQGRFPQANGHFERAYMIMEGYARKAVGENPQRFYRGFLKGILFDWAHSLEAGGQPAAAAAKYREAIALDPADPVPQNNLRVLLGTGPWEPGPCNIENM